MFLRCVFVNDSFQSLNGLDLYFALLMILNMMSETNGGFKINLFINEKIT